MHLHWCIWLLMVNDMRTPTVAEFLNTLENLSKSYPFDNDDSLLELHYDFARCEVVGIRIRTRDSNGSDIVIERDFDFMENNND